MSRLEKLLSRKEVLSLTNGGEDIFRREGIAVNRKIASPLSSGTNDSFKVVAKDGVWLFKDFRTGQAGDAIKFLEVRYNLSFKDAIRKAISDNGVTPTMIPSAPIKLERLSQDRVVIDFQDAPFRKHHHEYWNEYHLSEDFLRRNHVYAVRRWAVNKKVQTREDGEIVFAYLAKDTNEVKILRIGVPDHMKWRTGVANTYLWNYYKHEGKSVDNLFVCKSRKDELVLMNLEYDTISIQNESAKILLENNVGRIEKVCPNPILCLGSDPQADEQTGIILQTCQWRNFQTPHGLIDEGVNDPAEFVKKFSPDRLDKLIKRRLLEP